MRLGAQRNIFPRSGNDAWKLDIGSHLTVCDRDGHNLWSVDVQRALLAEHGCSVHCTISPHNAGGTPSHAPSTSAAVTNLPLYTFEAAVSGDMLTGLLEHDLHLCLADVNGRVNGNEFWSDAMDVESIFLPKPERACK